MEITRQEYFKRQKDLSKLTARAELEAATKIKKITRLHVLPLVKEYAETRNIIFPVEQLAHDITAIILEEAAKPVAAAKKLQADMEASLAEKLGVKLGHREPQENARRRRLENAREPVGTIIRTPGRGWGYGTSGLASYHRDPQTGKIVWDDLPLEYRFRKRADLSEQVWKAVEEQEQMVFDVIRGGRAAGRNVKDICGDLETFINYRDGGARVVGRWGKMFPNTEEGRREAWKREYLTAHGGLQPGSDAALALLYKTDEYGVRKKEGGKFVLRPEVEKWIETASIGKRGRTILPDAVRQYASRLGKAGLDYRAIRIARTETTAMVALEQVAIAENSDICTGEMDFVMERGRDHWNCNCEKYAEQNPWKVDDPDRPEIPVHPSCSCSWVVRLKTDEEILAALREEMKEDLETIQGTDEQADLLEQIDQGVIPSPSKYDKGDAGAGVGVALWQDDIFDAMEAASDTVALKSLTDDGDDSWRPKETQPASLRQNEPAIAKALEAEEEIRRYSNEAAVIIDRNGNVVYHNPWGKRDEVYIPKSLIRDNVVTHNHTSGGTFSVDDITRFAFNNGQEFRACTPSNINFSIRRGEGSTEKRIADDFKLVIEKTEREAISYARNRSKTEGEFNIIKSSYIKEKSHKWLAENALNYGYIYTVEDKER